MNLSSARLLCLLSALALSSLGLSSAPTLAQQEKQTPRAPENTLSPETFEAFASGTTLYFNRHGAPYGAEQYMTDRRVIWTFLDGRCERGAWFSDGAAICFAYETQSEAQCWHILEIAGQKRVRVVGDDPGNDLYVVGQDKADLDCPGPGVGVSYTPPD